MAIELKLNITQSDSGKQAVLVEITGEFGSANTGGWGAPNPLHTDAQTATITVSKRNDNGSYTSPTVVDVFSTMPNIDGSQTKVSSTDAGFGDTYPDGIYKFIYTVERTSATPFVVTLEKIVVFTREIRCCYQEKAEEVSRCDCACDDVDKEFKTIAFNLRILDSAICCANLDHIQGLIDYLTKLCDQCNNISS